MIEPLDLSFPIACPPEHAFHVWTARFADWWPATHSTSGDLDTHVVLEPHLGGRIYERTSTGDEIDWGEITLWDPPRRLGYLWHIRRDRSDGTDVEIRFHDAGDGTTRLDVHHTGWERLGAQADARHWRDANSAGWGGLIPHFADAAATI